MAVSQLFTADQLEDGNAAARTLRYAISGAANEDAAYSQLTAYRPVTLGALVVEKTKITQHVGAGLWEGEAHYKLPESVELPKPKKLDPPETGDVVQTFEFGLTTAHITNSLSTANKYAPSGDPDDAPDFKGAIGVASRGNGLLGVGGTDVNAPVFHFSYTLYKPVGEVTSAYQVAVEAVVGKTNDDTFKGFQAGEVFFEGIAGEQRNDEDWRLTFRFAVSRNLTGLSFGAITDVVKNGWQHLWVFYEQQKQTVGSEKLYVSVPRAVYVENIYESADFSTLGVGV